MRNLRLFAVLLLFVLPCFAGDKLKLEDIISRHLDSIGTAEARAAAKSRVAEGTVNMSVIVGGTGSLAGKGMLSSSGKNFRFQVRFPALDYPGENFFSDGQKTEVATITPNGRSALGNFLYRHDTILKEQLFGGVLATTWPLLDLSARNVKLRYDGLKKIDGRELHVVSYRAKKQDADLDIKLYFEPETFRHVMTIYSFVVQPSLSHNQLEHGSEIYYKVQEEFGNFGVVDGLTLPREWKIRYSSAPAPAITLEWVMKVTNIADNQSF